MLPEETPQMPPAADAPPSDRVSADFPVAPAADAAPDMPPNAASEPDGQTPEGQTDALPRDQPRRRRRRRRRRPPGEASLAASGEPAVISADQEPLEATVEDADLPAGEGAAESASEQEPGAALAPSDRPRRRRRRRRPPPPGGLGSALPRADAGTAAGDMPGDGSEVQGIAGGEAGAAPASADAARGATGYLRLPVRGRRRLPRPPGLQRGAADGAPPNGDAQADGAEAGGTRVAGEYPSRHRRRRSRPPPRIGDALPAGQDRLASGALQDAGGPPRARGPNRRPGQERSRDTQPAGPGDRQDRGPRRGPRDGDNGAPRLREPFGRDDRGARSRGPGGRGDGARGRGRDAPARRVEQKLYTLESMVDRGFDDVADEAEDSGSRRVHWTIVKRSVADQKSGKAMSTTYVLQREGAETEFPNLGAARMAANKTIVHPEKLTMSKAEHVAAKNSK